MDATKVNKAINQMHIAKAKYEKTLHDLEKELQPFFEFKMELVIVHERLFHVGIAGENVNITLRRALEIINEKGILKESDMFREKWVRVCKF